MPHFAACWRTTLIACRPSSAAISATCFVSGCSKGPPGSCMDRNNSCMLFWKSASVDPVSTRRYFSTKAVTPRSLSHSATFVPSLSHERNRNAPPGAITTAVPFAVPGLGRKGVRVGRTTLRTILRSPGPVMSSFRVHFSEPGAMPGQIANSAFLSLLPGCCMAALAPLPSDRTVASTNASGAMP